MKRAGSEPQIKNPRAAPEGHGSITNIPMAVERSCWRWRLGPNVPGVGWLVLLGHLRRCKRSVDGSDEHSVSERTTRPRLGETVGAGACSQRCFWSVLRWGISHRLAPPWVDGLRFAPPAAAHNRPLHALPCASGGCTLICLGCSQGARGSRLEPRGTGQPYAVTA